MTKVILVMGPPGCGKGTQATLLKEKYNIAHISTGDLFRNEIASKTELGNLAKSFIDKGQYVPDEVTANMLAKRIKETDCTNGFILDGFPRTIPQAEFLEKTLQDENISISAIIYYDASEDIVINRIKGRAEKAKLAGKTVRDDDLNEEIIKQRLRTYKEQTEPVLEFYKEKLITVNANNEEEQIFAETIAQI